MGAIDCMSAAEIGAAYRVLQVAWFRNGHVPSDVAEIIRLARLAEPDRVHVQSLITRAGQHEADGKSIKFPVLLDVLSRTRQEKARRSNAGRKAAIARHHGPEDPDPGGGGSLRYVCESQCDRTANAVPAQDPSELFGSRRSCHSETNQERSSARSSATTRAPGAKRWGNGPNPARYMLDLEKLTEEQAKSEVARRNAVRRIVNSARIPDAVLGQDILPSNVSESIELAPWVTEEIAAFALFEARRITASCARRGEAFKPIGLIITITGTSEATLGKPRRQFSFAFQRWWDERKNQEARQAEAVRIRNEEFIRRHASAKTGGTQ